jgi:hypothetical protein
MPHVRSHRSKEGCFLFSRAGVASISMLLFGSVAGLILCETFCACPARDDLLCIVFLHAPALL